MIKKNLLLRIFSSIFLSAILFFVIYSNIKIFNTFLILLILITFYEWKKLTKNFLITYFGYIFIAFSFLTVHLVKSYDLGYFLFLLLICVSTDIGGFLFGKIFGGPKLTSISPNKTISGLIGSFLLTLISSYLFLKFYFLPDTLSIYYLVNNYFFILFCSFVSQFGDLIVSYFKRKANVKDTGNIIPGHGGILDRIDGMIFVFPFFYIILLFF